MDTINACMYVYNLVFCVVNTTRRWLNNPLVVVKSGFRRQKGISVFSSYIFHRKASRTFWLVFYISFYRYRKREGFIYICMYEIAGLKVSKYLDLGHVL